MRKHDGMMILDWGGLGCMLDLDLEPDEPSDTNLRRCVLSL